MIVSSMFSDAACKRNWRFSKRFFSKLPGDSIENCGYFSRVFSKLPGDSIENCGYFSRFFSKLPGDFIENYILNCCSSLYLTGTKILILFLGRLEIKIFFPYDRPDKVYNLDNYTNYKPILIG